MAAANTSQELSSLSPKNQGTLPVISTVPPQAKMPGHAPEPSSSRRLVEDDEGEVPPRRGIRGLIEKISPTMVLENSGSVGKFFGA